MNPNNDLDTNIRTVLKMHEKICELKAGLHMFMNKTLSADLPRHVEDMIQRPKTPKTDQMSQNLEDIKKCFRSLHHLTQYLEMGSIEKSSSSSLGLKEINWKEAMDEEMVEKLKLTLKGMYLKYGLQEPNQDSLASQAMEDNERQKKLNPIHYTSVERVCNLEKILKTCAQHIYGVKIMHFGEEKKILIQCKDIFVVHLDYSSSEDKIELDVVSVFGIHEDPNVSFLSKHEVFQEVHKTLSETLDVYKNDEFVREHSLEATIRYISSFSDLFLQKPYRSNSITFSDLPIIPPCYRNPYRKTSSILQKPSRLFD